MNGRPVSGHGGEARTSLIAVGVMRLLGREGAVPASFARGHVLTKDRAHGPHYVTPRKTN